MKRRNLESAKIRRAVKRNKISDSFYNGSLIYLKLLLIWASVIAADFLFQVRFEYLWMFWLLLRSIYDSFRYQGTAFSVFFVFVTVTSDVVCYLHVPVQWLFFLASTYVWVQYVWHADRGICVPTVSLWLLFIYVEASIRLRELKMVPFTLDLCRPFAAHCIGYPVVSLGFGVKSYVDYKLRLRKQREVAKINHRHEELLEEALPRDETTCVDSDRHKHPNQSVEDIISNSAVCNGSQHLIANGGAVNGNVNQLSASSRSSAKLNAPVTAIPKKSSSSPSQFFASSVAAQYRHKSADGLYENRSLDDATVDDAAGRYGADEDVDGSNSSILDIIKAKFFSTVNSTTADASAKDGACCKNSSWTATQDSDEESQASKESRDSANVAQLVIANVASKRPTVGKQKARKRFLSSFANVREQKLLENIFSNDPNIGQPLGEEKEKVQDKDLYLSLESDIDKLKAELRTSRSREQDLRNQVQQFSTSDAELKRDLQQLRQNNEQLQTRIQNLVRSRQQDKQNLATIEKKLADEQKHRSQVEQSLQQERKQRKAAEDLSRPASGAGKTDCTAPCKQRRRELDLQLKQVQHDLQQREEQVSHLETELRSLRAYKEQNNVEILMSALSAMQEKTVHLEAALSSETRIKLDLFSALGEARRQLEIVRGKLARMEQEANDVRHQMKNEKAISGGTFSTRGTMPDLVTVPSHFTPPPSVGPADNADLDLLGQAAYQAASYMTALSGGLFNGDLVGPADFGMLSPVATGQMPILDFPPSSNSR